MGLLTASTALLVLYGLATRRYDRALALAGATSAGAALVLGPVAVPTFYAVAAGLVVVLGARFLGSRGDLRRLAGMPGWGLFLGFFGWSVLVTVVAPLLFSGLRTETPSGAVLAAGDLTMSNVAQIVYLGLSVCVVVIFAYTSHIGPQAIGLTLYAAILLSGWRYLAVHQGVPFPEGVFDNSPTFAYIETAAGGVERFRGITSEPAALAGVVIATMTYAIARARQVGGARRIAHLLVGTVAALLGAVSTSTSFVVVGMIMLGLVAVVSLGALLGRRAVLAPSSAATLWGAGVLLVAAAPAIYAWVTGVVGDKVESDSFDARSGTDARSFEIFLDTYGFGVGLGSGRASSFVATLLSTTGFVGTLLFVGAIAAVVGPALAVRRARPVVWVLAAVLATKIVSGPDLSPTDGLLWMCLGVLAGIVVAHRREEAARADEGGSQAMRHSPAASRVGPTPATVT
ncbi:hypothetical protein [Demequina sp. NBRC 110052]|uniref:hypothetical protein n=1 Tax=Demequina sp. NBRC 110052 TaxID=1570341 RepID=UPI00135663E2|nr:hypothetical protein [Demequina sp. NBRC 110052]